MTKEKTAKRGSTQRKNEKRNDKIENNETPTMYKNNSRDSSKFKGYSPLQLSCNLTGKCHAVGYYSYTNR